MVEKPYSPASEKELRKWTVVGLDEGLLGKLFSKTGG